MPRKTTKKQVDKINPKYQIHYYIYVPIIIGLGILILTFIYIAMISFGGCW